jgi:DNA adenine methylase
VSNLKPLFRWAGGKGKMLRHYEPLLPSSYSAYCEPFFGGGAMFAHIKRTNPNMTCYINDVNEGIVNIYTAIRNDVFYFLDILDHYDRQYIPLDKEKRKEFYYATRHDHAWDYQHWNNTHEAAVFYFLLKTSFNGILQINKNTNNRFGTPSGLLNEKGSVYDRANVMAWHDALQSCVITCGDWHDCAEQANKESTFFFMDPPYRESFTSYGQLFTDADQIKLLQYCQGVNDVGGKVLLCNRDDNDNFWDGKEGCLSVARFPITYTAGRRKKTAEGFIAKPATEILFYSPTIVNTLPI